MADKTLTCKDCNAEFVFTEGEQAFYAEKGFQNEPQRCPDCRQAGNNKEGTAITTEEVGFRKRLWKSMVIHRF